MQWRAGTRGRADPGLARGRRARRRRSRVRRPGPGAGLHGRDGRAQAGERVLLNASALLRGLGTGGLAFVVARADVLPADPEPGPGHIVKARYTPLQQMLLPWTSRTVPTTRCSRGPTTSTGCPSSSPTCTVRCPRSSPACACGAPGRPVAYVMTDGGALPSAFSRAVAGLREAGWLAACITVGQAFGGDHEAVTVHTGLLAARHVVGADVVVVAQGPGNVGTGTRWGYSGVAAAEALHAADVLGGRGIASLRVSGADRARTAPRHQPPQPHRLRSGAARRRPRSGHLGARTRSSDTLVREQAGRPRGVGACRLTPVEVAPAGLAEALDASPVGLSTWGGDDEDPRAVPARGRAGAHAAPSAQLTPMRSTTKISDSPGLMTPPAPRSP